MNFNAPANGYVTNGGAYSASLQLLGTADPKTLKVTSGNVDVTSQFNPSSCPQAPCTLSATLTTNIPGQNFLTATVRGSNGASDSSTQRFTNGASAVASLYPPHLVRIQQIGTTITVMSPTPNTLQPCSSPNIRIAVFNRMTLTPGNSGCVAPAGVDAELSRYDRTNLIIVAAPYGSGNADFTKMGGNGDTSTNKLGYYGVGYGIGVKGSAFEAWQESYDDGTHPKTINGNLVNIGCTASMPACSQTPNAHFYAFEPTNAMGFAIVPGAAGTAGNPGLPTIYVGNPSRVPLNGTTPPNQVRPQVTGGSGDLFAYQTYKPTWTGGNAAGGFYLVVLNRSDLTKRFDKLYVTNGSSDDNGAMRDLAATIAITYPNDLFLLTTVGIPFNVDSNASLITSVIGQLGGTPYPLHDLAPNRLGNPAKAGFSIVAHIRNPNDLVPARLYSSSANAQQGETGALRGVFSKGQTAYYEAKNANSFDVASLPAYATGDDYLAHALSASVGSTEPVAWPQMETAAKQAAYQYLSKQLLAANLGLTGDCGLTCYDVRYYYTGIDAPTLFNKLQPNQVAFSQTDATAKNYSSSDFQLVQAQLQQEAIYLGDVVNLQSYTTELNANSSLNVGSALRVAGATVTTDLEQTLKVPSTTTSNSPVGIASDVFNTLGAVSSIPGVFFPPMGVLAGVCSVTANILNIFHNESSQTVTQEPSPYVTQLEQLTQADTVAAESAATKFANDQMNAMGTFYNGVYSDWFRLQSVALLSVDQGAGGWYIANKDTARTQYLQTLSVTVRANLWQQLLPQYFTQGGYRGVATGYHKTADGTDDSATFSNFLSRYNGPNPNLKASDFTNYSWDYRTSMESNACEDYVFLFTNNEWGTPWPDALGNMLFGNATSADGLTSQLNLDRNWVYDALGFPVWANMPIQVNDSTRGNHNVSWRCSAFPWPYGASGMVNAQFVGIPASQTIVKGSVGTITLSGVIQGAGANSSVRPKLGTPVRISVGDSSVSTTTSDANGTFSTAFSIADLPASPVPYIITYSFEGTGQGEASGGNGLFATSDSSTTLTILSTNTEATLTVSSADVTYPAQTFASVLVKSPAGSPVGTLNLLDGATTIATKTLAASDAGGASWTLNLDGGQHQLSVQFAGQSPYQTTVSNTVSVNVRQAASYLSINTLEPVGVGTQNVTVAANFRYDANIAVPAGGAVTVSLGDTQRTTTIQANGAFSVDLPIAGLAAGQYTVNVSYAGTVSIAPLNRALSLEIRKVYTAFTGLGQFSIVAGDKTPIVLRGNLTKSGNLTPSGTVYVDLLVKPSGNSVYTSGKVNLVDGGFTLTLDTSQVSATPSAYWIRYFYSGDDYFNLWQDQGTSSLTVTAPPTTMTFSSSAPSADYGANVTFTATVSAANAKPSGNVIFKDGDTQLASVALDSNGQAAYTISTLAIGTHTITATYDGGSGNFGISSASVNQVINRAATTTTLTTSLTAPADYAAPVNFTARVMAGQQPASDGIVEFYDASTLLGSSPVSNGNASFTTSSLPVGTRSIIASYKPSGASAASSTSSTLPVEIAPLAISFKGLTPSQTVADGTSTVALAGQLSGTIAPATRSASVLQFSQLTTGDSNGGATFTGMPNASQLSTNNATYGVWIKTTAQTKQMIFQGADYRPFIYMQGDKIGVIFRNAGPDTGWLSNDTRPISDGAWHHVLVTFNNGAITIYKDGVATSDTFTVTAYWAATNYMNLGASWGDIPSFVGSMWNAQIWNQSFTWVDVANKMYRVFGPNNPNIVLQSVFDADAGTAVNASNGAAGTYKLSTITKDEVPAMAGGVANFTELYNDQSGSGIRLIPVATSSVNTDHASYSVWIKTKLKTQQMILAGGAFQPALYIQDDRVGVIFTNSGPDAGWLSTDTTPISDGRWHQITVTFDMGKITIYKDGVATADSFNVTARGTASTYVILSGSWANIPSFVGQMWNVKVWSRVLSPADISAEMFTVYDDGNSTPDLQAQSWFAGNSNWGKNSVNSSVVMILRAGTAVAPLPSSYPAANAAISISAGTSTQNVTTGATGLFTASLPTASVQPGSYPVQYSYAGGGNLKAAANNGTILTIGNAATTFSGLTPSPTVELGTKSVTLGGTIKAGTVVPAGNVSITVNNVAKIAAIQTDGTFSTSIDLTGLAIGTYPVTFNYDASNSFSGARDTTRTITIQAAASTTIVVSSANPADAGTPVKFTATVTGANGTPAGSVTFYDGATAISDPVPLAAGNASFSTSALTGGQHIIKAAYDGGDGSYKTSSGSVTQNINKVSPYFTVLSASLTIATGTPSVNLGGTIATDTLVPTGSVVILVNGVSKSAAIQANGTFSATFDTSTLPVDTYAVIYEYAENDTFSKVRDTTSTKLTVQNIAQATSTVVTSSESNSDFGSTVTFTATVTAATGTPAGTATFFDGGTQIGMSTLSANGIAKLPTSALSVGSHQITATYAPASSSLSLSTSQPVTQTVTALPVVFRNLTPSQSVPYGTGSVTLSGKLAGTIAAGNGGVANFTELYNDESGSGVYMSVADSSNLSTDHATYSVWIKTTAKTQQMLLAGGDIRPFIYMQGDQLGVMFRNAGPDAGWVSTDTTPISDGRWHQITVTFDQGKVSLYKDGVPTADSFTVTKPWAATSYVILSGSWSGIPSFIGQMWNVKVWSRALNPAEIAADMYKVYADGTATPDLQLQSAFDATANKPRNTVGGPAATFARAGFVASSLPADYPVANADISIAIGTSTQKTVSDSTGVFTTSFVSSAIPSGVYPVRYSYTGNGNLKAADNNGTTLTVTAMQSALTLASSVNPSTLGAEVTFTATVTVSSGTPTGTVTFKDGTTTLGSIPLTGGVAAFKTSALMVGAHPITAVYSGDANFGTSTSTALTQTVNAATSTTMVASSLNPSTSGAEVTFMATVTVSSGTPTGTVTFKDGATTLGSMPLTGGVAAFKTSALTVGAHSITAVYSGDTNFGTSNSTVLTQTVNAATSTTTIASSLNPSTSGAEVTFAATVTVTSGTPTGTVTFKDGTTTIGSSPLTGGVAAFKTSALTVGTHAITAVYSGDANFGTSTSTVLTQTVNAATSTTTIASSLNPSTSGAEVTFAATVTVSSGTPTGTVTFKDGATTLGSMPLTGGVAAFKTSALTVGAHSITAVYSGDTNFGTSTSTVLMQAVNAATSSTTIASSLNPSTSGAEVTFMATVTVSSGTPTGTVTFKDGATTLGSMPLTGGMATFKTSALTVGTHSITAVYSGDTNFGTSTSTVLTQTVNAATSTTTIASSLNPSTSGAEVVFTATVTVTSGTPTGTVTFKDGATTLGSMPLTGGVAAFKTSALTVGTHAITAIYSGDTNFGTSASTVLTQTVNGVGPVQSNFVFSYNPAPAILGKTVTFRVAVTPVNGIVPTGNLTISETQKPDGSPMPNNQVLNYGSADLVDGVATIVVDATLPQLQYLTAGLHSLAITYSGDSVYPSNNTNGNKVQVDADLAAAPEKAVLRITTGAIQRSGDTLTVALRIENTGNAAAYDTKLTQIAVRALTGTGAVSVVTPLPVNAGVVAPQGLVVRTVTLNVPPSVSRISLTETGTLRDVSTPSAAFSSSQMLILN